MRSNPIQDKGLACVKYKINTLQLGYKGARPIVIMKKAVYNRFIKGLAPEH